MRRWGSSLLSLPWVRAPKAALGSPVTVLVAVVTGLVLTFVLASTAFSVSASGAAATRYLMDSRCYGETGLRVGQSDRVEPFDTETERRVREIAARHGADHVLRTRVYDTNYLGVSAAPYLGASSAPRVRLLSRDEAFGDLRVLAGGGTDGVWLPDDFAAQYRVGPGDRVAFATAAGPVEVPVAAVYQRPTDPVSPLWCAARDLMVLNPLAGNSNTPPPPVVVTPGLLDTLAARGLRARPSFMDFTTHRSPVTRDEAARWADSVEALRTELAGVIPGPVVTYDNAKAVADNASGAQRAVGEAVLPLTAACLLVGLLGVLGLATQWAQRRGAELTLLWTRGVSPAAIGVKAVLELGLPLLLGAALGWVAARFAVPLFAPTDAFDPWASWAAAGLGVLAWVLALVVLGVAAARRVRRQFTAVAGERGRAGMRARKVARFVPWELLIGAGAFAAWSGMSGGAVVVGSDAVPRVSLLALVFPLLCLAALVGLATRIAGALARASHRVRGWRSPTVIWALRRTAAQRRVAVALLGVAGLAVGVIAVGVGVSVTERNSVTDKGWVLIGSDHAITLKRSAGEEVGLPESLRGRATRVARTDLYIRDNLPGRFTLVDPATFADGARWRDSWADQDLPGLMRLLDDATRQAGAAGDRTVPVIVVGEYPLDRFVRGGLPPMRAVATVPSFPGLGHARGMLVASWHALPPGARSGYYQEVLTRDDPAPAVAALAAAGERTGAVLDAAKSANSLPFLVVGWIFAFFVVLGVALALVAVVTLLVAVETRRRSTAVAHALLVRMGLRTRSLLATHLVELAILAGTAAAVGLGGGWAILGWSVPRLDPFPLLNPAPAAAGLHSVGLVTLVVAVAAVVGVAGYAVWAARRAPVKELLRG